MAVEADRLGLQITVHAIGDAAVRRALDGYEAAIRANGRRDSRRRIEHIETIHPDDIPRFAKLGVIASMQPLHSAVTLADPYVMPQRVGKDRWPTSFAWQTLREAGARLVFGSDWPVVTQNPMKGLYAALNRQPWAEGHPEQKQTLENALLAYTRDAAYAEFQEANKGQIKAGLLADLVLLPVDIFGVDPAAIGDISPVMTISGGQIVYEA
jgi:predicted amidohydrolase YtcJ